jgi:hypothetical protein
MKETYTRAIKITFLESLKINDRAFDEIPKWQRIPCEKEYLFKAVEVLHLAQFKIRPEHLEIKLKERMAYLKRLYSKKKILKVEVMQQYYDNLIDK